MQGQWDDSRNAIATTGGSGIVASECPPVNESGFGPRAPAGTRLPAVGDADGNRQPVNAAVNEAMKNAGCHSRDHRFGMERAGSRVEELRERISSSTIGKGTRSRSRWPRRSDKRPAGTWAPFLPSIMALARAGRSAVLAIRSENAARFSVDGSYQCELLGLGMNADLPGGVESEAQRIHARPARPDSSHRRRLIGMSGRKERHHRLVRFGLAGAMRSERRPRGNLFDRDRTMRKTYLSSSRWAFHAARS